MTPGPDGLRLDLGCGATKKADTIGLDIQPQPGVDLVIDLEAEPLPFGDQTVSYVHASHFLEHLSDPARIFSEISRVCIDGAKLEFWLPYAGSNPGFVLGHKTFFTEDIFLHICCWYADFWQGVLHARWVLDELRYVIDARVLTELSEKDVDLAFALTHFRNVATEFGVHMTVSRKAQTPGVTSVVRTFSLGRFEPPHRLPEPHPDPEPSRVAEAIRRLTSRAEPSG